MRNGGWWREAEEWVGNGGSVGGLILFSDKTHADKKGRHAVHGVHISLGNISLQHRHCHTARRSIVFLPTFSRLKVPAAVKVAVFHACFERILQPLIEQV